MVSHQVLTVVICESYNIEISVVGFELCTNFSMLLLESTIINFHF